jgi:tight adherence protein C
MTSHPAIVLAVLGIGILVLVAAALVLLVQAMDERAMTRRLNALLHQPEGAQPRSPQAWSAVVSLTTRLGNGMRDSLLSANDVQDLTKTLAAAGFEPSQATPIFMGVKVASLFGVPALVYLAAVLLGYPPLQQALGTGAAVVMGMMLPNWAVALVHRRYQASLRRGLPDALDLMVVCAEAGLGLGSTIERVAQEMKKSNRPVALEFSLFSHEMRVMPDRRMALAKLAERSGQPAFKRLAATLAQTLKFGTPLSQALRTLAAELRNERMLQFEERAGKLPALLVMPMMLFILPCLFIILLGKPATQLLGLLASLPR